MGTRKWLTVLASHPEPHSLGLLSLLTLTLEPFWGQEEAPWRNHTFCGLLSLPCSHSHALPHLPWKHILNEPNLRQGREPVTPLPSLQPVGRAGMRRGWLQKQRLDRLREASRSGCGSGWDRRPAPQGHLYFQCDPDKNAKLLLELVWIVLV